MSTSDFEILNDILRRYTGPGGHVVIPEGITRFGWGALQKNDTITEVTIPASMKVIDNNALSECSALKKVNFAGENLTAIRGFSFSHCPALEEIRLPDSIRQVPPGIFTNCPALQKRVGNAVIAAEVLLKYTCEPGQRHVRIPDGVRFIPGAVFGDSYTPERRLAEDVETIEIPEGVVYIGTNAFKELKKLKSITLPSTLRVLGDGALSFLPKLERLDISHTQVEVLENNVLMYCRQLQELLLPEGLKQIKNSVVEQCAGLKHLELPASLEVLGSNDGYSEEVFSQSGLEEITLPEGITEIPLRSFFGCRQLKKVTLPASVKKIGKEAFLGCVNLTEINIPAGLTDVGEDAFCHCCSLDRPEFPEALTAQEDFWGNIGFGDENGCVVKDGVLLKYVGPLNRVVITEGVSVIEKDALNISWMLNANPTEYVLPDSLKVIHEQTIGQSYHNIRLPEGYLQTQEALPAAYTVTLLEGAWARKAKPLDYAAMYLFQKGKTLLKLVEQKLTESPEQTLSCFVQLLSGPCKAAHVVKAAEFVLENKKHLSTEEIGKLYAIAADKKAKKAVELLKPLAGDAVSAGEPEKKAKAPSKKEVAAEALCAPFRAAFDEYLLDKTFKSKKGKDALLKTIQLKTGEAAPVYLTKCAIVPYLEQCGERPKHIGGYKTDSIPVKIVEMADQAAALLNREQLQKALEELYKLGGALWLVPLCRYGSKEQISALITDMRKWENWYTYGATGRGNIIIARGALMLSDTREAMMYLDKCGQLYTYAAMRHMDEDSIRDTVLADFGLDEKGKLVYDLGGKTIEVSLAPNLSLKLLDLEAGKEVKSLPKKGSDPELLAAASASLSDMKKNLKKVVKGRNDILFSQFLGGGTRNAGSWKASYLGNPVLNMVARLLVWKQGLDTFILSESGAVNCFGEPYTIRDSGAIGVAHPMEMDKDTLEKWRQYLCSKGIVQPFEQMWEPAYAAKDIAKDRYKGTQVSVFRFMRNEKHGISFCDEDFHNNIGFWLTDCDLEYERTQWHRHEIGKDETFTLGNFSFRRYTRRVNHLVYLLDKWTVLERIAKDDVTVEQILPSFTLAQITEFIKVAAESNSTNVTALLLNYKNQKFADFDPMEEFSLEL